MKALRGDQELPSGRRDALTELPTRTIKAEVLLQSLRKKPNKADKGTKRQLIEALVDRIVVDSRHEGGSRHAEVTITYLFEKPAKKPPGKPPEEKPHHERRVESRGRAASPHPCRQPWTCSGIAADGWIRVHHRGASRNERRLLLALEVP